MKIKLRGMLSVGVILCMVMSMLPAMSSAAAAEETTPQVSYTIGNAYKYTSADGISALAYGTDSPKTSTAVSSIKNNVVTLGTTAGTSSTSTNYKLIYVPVAITVTVPANTSAYYVRHYIDASATRVVEDKDATATASAAAYYLGESDTSSGLTFYPYYGNGASKSGTDASEIGMVCQGEASSKQKTFSKTFTKLSGYKNSTNSPVEVTRYFGVMIAITSATTYKNTVTANFTFTSKYIHRHDSISYDTPFTVTSGTVTSGNYYLTEDITTTDDITIEEGEVVNLCLNGKTIDLKTYTYIENAGTLTICDCSEDKTGAITNASVSSNYGTIYNNGGTFTLKSGSVTAASTYQTASAIYNCGGGTVNVMGGTIDADKCGIKSYDDEQTVNVSGGTIFGGSYGIMNGQVYLFGDPDISGNIGGLYLYQGNIYAANADGTAAYTGDTITVFLGDPTVGNVAVSSVTDVNKDKFVCADYYYYFVEGTGDNAGKLVIRIFPAQIKKHYVKGTGKNYSLYFEMSAMESVKGETFIVALYDGQGGLVGVKTISSAASHSYTATDTITTSSDAATYKIMLWNSNDTLIPSCMAASGDITAQ